MAYEAGSLEVAYRPAAVGAPAEDRSDFTAPRTPAEEVLAAIFAEVLGQPRVGVHDDFFALGGDSLRATQVVARLQSRFGIEFKVTQLFEGPTVAAVAAWVDAAGWADGPRAKTDENWESGEL